MVEAETLKYIDREAMGIEVGPWHSPLATRLRFLRVRRRAVRPADPQKGDSTPVPLPRRRSPRTSRLLAFVKLSPAGLRYLRRNGPRKFARRLLIELRYALAPGSRNGWIAAAIDLNALSLPEAQLRTEPVDIIVCVHNALADVQNCLTAVLRSTLPPYRLIIVDDGSGPETRDYLRDFAADFGAVLMRNEQALGYTRAANRGLRASDAPWVVLLNSDTIVTEPWLDAMWAHGWRDPGIGIIGPLSNAASWQSVPQVRQADDWVVNDLPDGFTPQDMADLAAGVSIGACTMPFLNGFCYMIRHAVIEQIGYFDEENFGAGYGEENDYSIRAREAGFRLLVATNAYVFHAHSKSYSSERRRELAKNADRALTAKHNGDRHIYPQVHYCKSSLMFASMRARVQAALHRRTLIDKGRLAFEGKRIAFILPIASYGGGGNVVMQEAKALGQMGVNVAILNFASFQQKLDDHLFPDAISLRTFADGAEMLRHLEKNEVGYDAIVATVYSSVSFLPEKPLGDVRCGYYIQDFEPRFFPRADSRHAVALASYTRRDDLRLFTKTLWNQRAVTEATGRLPCVVGCSVDVDRFTPSEKRAIGASGPPLKIAAMLRPSTPRRGAARTVSVLSDIVPRNAGGIEVIVFGSPDEELKMHGLRCPWFTNYGHLNPAQVSHLLGNSDIFVDFSDYQAMGLTALEAMAAGCAVVAPAEGGATSFLRDGISGILADTSSIEDCVAKTQLLVSDAALRREIQYRAIEDAHLHVPEAAALNILKALFD